MMLTPRTAVILAAGMGTRLQEQGAMMPKGFIELGGTPIIAQSIKKLRNVGVQNIVIVTGHMKQYYDELAAEVDYIETVYNDKYAQSGSMYSLHCARDHISEDFLLLESDLIYEERALLEAIHFQEDHCVLLSGPTYSGDEVFVDARRMLLVAMSKVPRELSNIVGELVGISRISSELFSTMIDAAEKRFQTTLHVAYETDCIVDAAASQDIHCHLVDDLLWAEIDDDHHLRRARTLIYPAIAAKEMA